MKRFEDKVVLITGAASGIGRATAERLGAEGATLFCADVQAEGLEETAKLVAGVGRSPDTRLADVSDAAAVGEMIADVIERHGRIDVLCNIAGILHFAHTHEHSLDKWQQIIAVNLTGTFMVCQAALPHLLASRGNIVNMGSTAGLRGHAWTAAYSASKGGVHALTYAIAMEYAEQGLRANVICPGSVTTPMHEMFELPEGANPKLLRRIMPPDGVFRGPETVAATIAFIASEDGAHINGEYIRVDGGTQS